MRPARVTAALPTVRALAAEGLSNAEIGRRTGVDPATVRHLRRELGIPPSTNGGGYPSLVEAFRANTRPVDGGHLEWTGGRQSTSGTPVVRYRDRAYTAGRLAFRLRTGRDPQGQVRAECGVEQCVAPEHVSDTAERQRTREQLRYLTGGGVRPAVCVHGHDQAVEGRYEPDGTAYCEACKRQQRQRAVAS